MVLDIKFSEERELLKVLINCVHRCVDVVGFPLQIDWHLLGDDAAHEALHELVDQTPATGRNATGKVLDLDLQQKINIQRSKSTEFGESKPWIFTQYLVDLVNSIISSEINAIPL